MSTMTTSTASIDLEERLSRGAQWLFEKEQRGEMDGDYDRWLTRWLGWLAEYEESTA